MGSVLESQLDELFLEWFGWLDRSFIAYLFIGSAALLILLGICFALVRPRGIGFFVLLGSGLFTIVTTWLWYALPYMKSGHATVLAVIVIFHTTMVVGTYIAVKKPTAKECGVSQSLSYISLGLGLYVLWYGLLSAILYIPEFSAVIQFAMPFAILGGAMAILAGSVSAVVMRFKANPPPREIDLP